MKVVYPGTFDPVTIGHLDIIKRASKVFDVVVVGVSLSKDKNTMFSLKDRIKMIQLATKNMQNVLSFYVVSRLTFIKQRDA
jgi:pantetheine-phosphate adenylyltransferase